MSRTISGTMLGAVNAQETDKAFIWLLTLDHSSLSEPIRVTPDPMELLTNSVNRGVTSNGQEYVALPFEITLPKQDESNTPQAKLIIDNVSREIIREVRKISTPLSVKIQIVLSSDPDSVEIELDNFKLRDVSGDALTIQGDLVVDPFDREPYPVGRFNPSNFPAVFGG